MASGIPSTVLRCVLVSALWIACGAASGAEARTQTFERCPATKAFLDEDIVGLRAKVVDEDEGYIHYRFDGAQLRVLGERPSRADYVEEYVNDGTRYTSIVFRFPIASYDAVAKAFMAEYPNATCRGVLCSWKAPAGSRVPGGAVGKVSLARLDKGGYHEVSCHYYE